MTPAKPNTTIARASRKADSAPLDSVLLLDGGNQAYPRMLAAIEAAQASIHLEVYAFAPTGVGASFVEALGRAAGRGVHVHVQIDGWGSARGGLSVAAALKASGCKVRIYHRLLALLIGRLGSNHRKILLIDAEVAFLGGINIGDENLDQGVRLAWADLAVEIRGPQCANLTQMVCGKSDRSVSSVLHLYLSGLGGGWRLRRRYLKAFTGARHRIHVAHGYFMPDHGIVHAIAAAARRGIEVHLLLAGQSDVPFARAATRSLYRRLLAAGVLIHEWNHSVLHAKVATIDGRRLLVGSFNLDPLSLANLETLVEVEDSPVVGQVEAWIQDHIARSRSIASAEASAWQQRWLLDPLGRMVARLVNMVGVIIASRKRRRTRAKQTPASRRAPS